MATCAADGIGNIFQSQHALVNSDAYTPSHIT